MPDRAALRAARLEGFDPNENGLHHHGLFGLPFEEEESEIVLIPVPWEATVSYADGTAGGPEAIREASQQIDLYDPILPGGWRAGIFMQEPSADWLAKGSEARGEVKEYLEALTTGAEYDSKATLEKINELSESLNAWVEEECLKVLSEDKIVGLVGGEHSVPFGFLKALASQHEEYGILHLDAHADLREAYEGFTYSHASIFFNSMTLQQVTRLVQVGLRDVSEGEMAFARSTEGRIVQYFDQDIQTNLFEGLGWGAQCANIIAHLPQKVYVSFDIDGLEAWLCPGTGTPVPGGLSFAQSIYLLEKLVASGREIIGFDLCEVAPGESEWNGNVGARVLYKLCLLAAKSRNLLPE